MKKPYEEPEMKIKKINFSDILTSSPAPGETHASDGDNPGAGGSGGDDIFW